MAEDLTQRDKAAVLPDKPVDVASEDGARGEEGGGGPGDSRSGGDGPAEGEAVDEAGDGAGGGVADDGREAGEENKGPDYEPTAGEGAPGLSDG